MFLQEPAFRTKNVIEFDLSTLEPQQVGNVPFAHSVGESLTNPEFTGWMVNVTVVGVWGAALALGFAVSWLNAPGSLGF